MNAPKTILHFTILAIVLILAQAVCNKILLFGVAMPVIFIYWILRLPINLHLNWVLTMAFAMGLTIDLFNDTPGMHALSCTLLATMRHPVFNAYMPREDDMTDPVPSTSSMGLPAYLKYMATLVAAYCVLIFVIQAFTLHDLLATLARIGASALLSIILMIAIDSLVSTRREKRL